MLLETTLPENCIHISGTDIQPQPLDNPHPGGAEWPLSESHTVHTGYSLMGSFYSPTTGASVKDVHNNKSPVWKHLHLKYIKCLCEQKTIQYLFK